MLDRRRFLGLGAAATVGTLVGPGALGVAPASARTGRLGGDAFSHGVASGDPLADRVVLWTRFSTLAPDDVPLGVEIWPDDDPTAVRRVPVTAVAARDHTAKVDVDGLTPGTTYRYRFATLEGVTSPVGRTRTLPVDTARVRLAVVTCADYSRGFHNAYGRIADLAGTARDVDAVVHLGDYIYESAKNKVPGGRRDLPGEVRDLAGYRSRYATYRRDPNLQAVHAQHPMIWVWDDHEVVDGAWRDMADPSNHGDDTGETPGNYRARKAAGRRAAFEWLPVREAVLDVDAIDQPIDRSFRFGDLVELFMLDTRTDRDVQIVGSITDDFFTAADADRPDATILGAAQEERVHGPGGSFRNSDARWRLLGNQVVMSPIKVAPAPDRAGGGVWANPDQWDGYPSARRRLLDAFGFDPGVPPTPLAPDPKRNVVVLTGDVHASMAFELAPDPNDPSVYDGVSGRGSYAVELVAPSISSAGDPKGPGDVEDEGDVEDVIIAMGDQALRAPNPHLKYIEATRNGYLTVDITPDAVAAEFWHVPTVYEETEAEALDRAFRIDHGDPRLKEPLVPPPVVSELPAPALVGLAAAGAAAAVAWRTRREPGT